MKKNIVIILMIILVMGFSGCSRNKETVYEETHTKMDTVMTIKAYGNNAKIAVQEIFKRVDEIEQKTSVTIPTSDVSRINASAGREFVTVDSEVLKIIMQAVNYSKLTSGKFDITVGPLIQLWQIGTENQRVPKDAEIREKLSFVGYDKINIDEGNSSIMLEKEGMSIDLGGIAKGYTADEAVDILNKYGIDKAIINLGGSTVYLQGSKNVNQPWKIGIQHPRREQTTEFLCTLKEASKSVSTSGDYERYFIENGKRYHHILDPSTGYPAENGIIANTVVIDGTIQNSSMISDILSTSVFILGEDKGMKLCESIPGVQMLAATTDNRLIASEGLKEKIESVGKEYKFDAKGR